MRLWAATYECLVVRSIHRHCQFHLRVIQEAGSAPLSISEDVVGVIDQDVSGVKHVLTMGSTTATMYASSATRGDCRLSPHEAFSYDTCANTAPISEVGRWVSIETRRCATSSDTASSVALYALVVWLGAPTASFLREECTCLLTIWAQRSVGSTIGRRLCC